MANAEGQKNAVFLDEPGGDFTPKKYIANYELNDYEYNSFWKGRQYEHESEMMLLRRIVAKYISTPETRNIVDLGGAYGRLSPLYRDQFKNFIIADYSTHELSKARTTLQKYSDKMSLVALNVYSIPFKNETVDNILCVRLIHHIAYPEIMLKEASRVLKPGGIMILEVAHKQNIAAFFKALFTFKLGRFFSNKPQRIRHNPDDSQGIKEGQISIIFSFPIKFIEKLAGDAGFEVLEKIPCSFFRHSLLKKLIPQGLLLKMESFAQRFFSWLRVTPSIFFVLRKKGQTVENTNNSPMVEMLQCPTCGGKLTISSSEMKCDSCGETFVIRNDIYDLRDPKPEEITF